MTTYEVPRVQALPVADDQVSFQIDSVERLRWHFGRRYPRPFFYPLIGPSGRPVTRMGHPAAPDHDHHRSIWFAHQNVAGVSFWEEGKEPQIRQERWVLYEDGPEEAAMVVELGWYDAHNTRLMRQQLVAVLRPEKQPGTNAADRANRLEREDTPGSAAAALQHEPKRSADAGERVDLGEVELEVQATFTPEMNALELGKTNFGFFAVRVAKSISAHYGGGRLTSSAGAVGEKNIHEKPARWVNYSGPVVDDAWEGITYFDHPSNPGQPTLWHVRDDGWMEASFSQRGPYELKRDKPLVLRYLLHVHRGHLDPVRVEAVFQRFSSMAPYELAPRAAPYRHALRRCADP